MPHLPKRTIATDFDSAHGDGIFRFNNNPNLQSVVNSKKKSIIISKRKCWTSYRTLYTVELFPTTKNHPEGIVCGQLWQLSGEPDVQSIGGVFAKIGIGLSASNLYTGWEGGYHLDIRFLFLVDPITIKMDNGHKLPANKPRRNKNHLNNSYTTCRQNSNPLLRQTLYRGRTLGLGRVVSGGQLDYVHGGDIG